jgi:hypothetical protein
MNNPILSKEGKHHFFDDLEYWAQDGVIWMLDHRDEQVTAITCPTFRARMLAIAGGITRAKYSDDEKKHRDFAQEMLEVYKDAKEQGDPTDMNVLRHRYREIRRTMMITGKNKLTW